ncbi:MAG: PH domain-containing protein [Candidatus Krumholzibacteria bacterium]|nr:PH domain-containing protein [Candidatus Krumholzibacteria bacterium]
MKQVFVIASGTSGPLWVALAVGVFTLAIAGLMFYLAFSSRNVRFEVTSEALAIHGDMFGRTIPLSALDIDQAQRLDLRREPQYRARWRTFGTGLPGYSAGWFKLRNGEKALLFVTDSRRIVRIPTNQGYWLMVSPEQPEGFIESLRAAAAGG